MVFRFYRAYKWVKTVRDESLVLNEVSDLKQVLQFLYDHRPEYEYPETMFLCYLTSDDTLEDDLTLKQLHAAHDVLGIAVLTITPIMDSVAYSDIKAFPLLNDRFFYDTSTHTLYKEVR